MQAAVGHDREGHLELVCEAADECHHHQGDGERRGGLDVAQPLAELTPGARRRGGGRELGGVHRHQREHDRDEAGGVEQEADADADGGDQDAGDGRSDRPGDVDEHRIEADRVAEVLFADELHHERLPGRVLERVVEPQDHRQEADLPYRHRAGDGQQAERQRLHSHRRLQHNHQVPLVDAVGDHAAVGAEHQHRQRLEGDDDPERGARVRQVEHEIALRGHLHPGADEGDRLTADVAAVIGDGESCEGDASGADHSGHGRRSCNCSASISSAGSAFSS